MIRLLVGITVEKNGIQIAKILKKVVFHMKKFLLLLFVLLLLLNSCTLTPASDSGSINIEVTAGATASVDTGIDKLPVHVSVPPDQIKLDELVEQDYLEDEDFCYVPQFRWVYYGLYGWFIHWIDANGRLKEYDEFYRASYSKRLRPNGMLTDATEMNLAAVIGHFNIPREEVESYNAALWKSWALQGVDLSIPTEDYELPNLDIIYTFDNEIINAYYRREPGCAGGV